MDIEKLKMPPHSQSVKLRIVAGKPPDKEKKVAPMTKPPKADNQTDEIIHQWGLDKSLSLATLAADFYTLIDLQCDFANESSINEPLETLTALLADQFSTYLDMVIGGELRYAQYHIIGGYDKDEHEICYDSIDYMPISKTAKDILHHFRDYPDSSHRTPAWRKWQGIRKNLGTEALRAAKQVFNLDWEGGYGGKSWSNATTILLDYLELRLPAQAFIDTCFGLHHNNNIILDKVWHVSPALMKVLDYNKNNRMLDVAFYCSSKINKLRGRF